MNGYRAGRGPMVRTEAVDASDILLPTTEPIDMMAIIAAASSAHRGTG